MPRVPAITCPSRLPVAALPWRSRGRGEACAIVCKVSYRLERDVVVLAAEQDPLVSEDTYWDDDPARSLRAASDFAPAKRRADVLVVGSAFAPPGTKLERLVAYFGVGELSKALEVQADSWVDARNEIHHGSPFASMPLAWERAAHDERANPAGRAMSRDSYGRLNLPNLIPPAFEPGADWRVPAIGFGPIAPSWGTRTAIVGGASMWPAPHGALWPASWLQHGVPDDDELAFFQVAPADQQVDRIASDAPIVLERLSPTAARVGTRLAGDRVRAFISPQATELDLVCDTLVIDTDRQLLTLTWRGSYFRRTHPGVDRVLVMLEEPSRTGSVEDVLKTFLTETTVSLARQPEATPSAPGSLRATASSYAGTPFGPNTGGPVAAAQPAGLSLETAEIAALADSNLGSARLGQTFLGASFASDQAPVSQAWASPSPGATAIAAPTVATVPIVLPVPVVAPPPPPAPPAPVPPPPPAPAPLPPASTGLRSPPPAVGPIRPQAAYASARAPSSASLPSYLVEAPKPVVDEHRSHDPKAATSVVSASNAAGAVPTAEASPSPRPAASAEVRSGPRPAGYFDLLWFSPAAPERIRALPAWSKLLREGKKEWLNDKTKDGRSADDAERVVARALARGATLDAAGIQRLVRDAVDQEGFLVRPLTVVEGDLVLHFDPTETLAVSLSLAEPLASTDRKFKETFDATSELVAAQRKVTLAMIDAGLARLRQAFAAAGKAYPSGYLEHTAERWLIDERKYLKRTVLGQPRLFASLHPGGNGSPLVAYLPAELEPFLPTLPRFRVRVLAEPHARQDGADGDGSCLVALALARVVGR